MARAALGWSVKDLARRAHISHGTVVRFENERHEPNASTVVGIKQAFEAAGIEFSNGDAPGVKLYPRKEGAKDGR